MSVTVTLTDEEAKQVAYALDEWLDLVEHDASAGKAIESAVTKVRKQHPYFKR